MPNSCFLYKSECLPEASLQLPLPVAGSPSLHMFVCVGCWCSFLLSAGVVLEGCVLCFVSGGFLIVGKQTTGVDPVRGFEKKLYLQAGPTSSWIWANQEWRKCLSDSIFKRDKPIGQPLFCRGVGSMWGNYTDTQVSEKREEWGMLEQTLSCSPWWDG